MSEIFTPTPESQKPVPEQQSEDDFSTITEIQNDQDYAARERQAAERLLQESAPTAEETTKPTPSNFSLGHKVAAGVGLTVTAFAGGAVAADHIAPSETVYSTTATVSLGNGVEVAVDEAIGYLGEQGADPADTIERQDVISQAVDILNDEDGVVQPGESVQVIVEKSPVFGIETYKAVPVETEGPNLPLLDEKDATN